MPSGTGLSLIVLAVAAASLAFLIQAEGGMQAVPRLLERVGLPSQWLDPLLPPTSSPTSPAATGLDLTSGNSRFSQGNCSQDSDCQVSGCSSEVCGREPTVSTCEYSESFPTTATHSCGCINRHCGWAKK